MSSEAQGKEPDRGVDPPRPFLGANSASGMDDGLITFGGMESVALAFVAIPSVREHQATLVRERLLSLVDRAKGRMAVSLEDVGDMTSAGMNALVAVHARCKELGGHLVLFGMSKELRRMFKVTKLDREIVIVDTAHEAVRSFETQEPKRRFWSLAFTWAKQERDAA
jgi:anti-anti-sigma factor